MKPFRVILFDLDDTLFDFKKCWEIGMKETMRTHPITSALNTEELYERFEHYSISLWPLQAEGKLTMPQYRRLRIMRAFEEFGKKIDDAAADEFNAQFLERNLNAIPHTHELVQMMSDFSQTYRLGIITNGPADVSYKKVMRLGLGNLIPEPAVFVSERVGYAKPDCRIFEAALDYFQVDAGDVVFVGDNWEADIVGAIDAGMAAVWLNRRKEQAKSEHQPLAVIEELSELREVLFGGRSNV